MLATMSYQPTRSKWRARLFFFLIKEVIKLLPIVAAMVTGRFSGGESEASDNGRKWKLPLRPHFY